MELQQLPPTASTSRHRLNADGKLSRTERVLWMAFNLINNSFPRTHVDQKLGEFMFSLNARELGEMWDEVDPIASPARRLCDFFWMHLPWRALTEELGNVTALELGCGTGVYGRLLGNHLGNSLARYVGVDIQADEKWAGFSGDTRFVFEVGRASEVHKYLGETNFILTQSALEHFEADLLYFNQVAQYVSRAQRPIFQVHLVPSASCMTTFPWHGVREYTPRTLSSITRLFGTETQCGLFSLGSAKCNRVHRKFITWPNLRRQVDRRAAEASVYQRDLRSAIVADFAGSSKSAAFYALVLASNFADDHLMARMATPGQ